MTELSEICIHPYFVTSLCSINKSVIEQSSIGSDFKQIVILLYSVKLKGPCNVNL